MQKPGLYWQNNVMGSLNLIQAAVDHGCMDFVFSSTCATYGDQDNVVLDEHSAQHPINAYGASKRAVENILADFGAAYGLNSVIFRYFNVAGADPDGAGWRIPPARNAFDPVDFGCDRRKTGCADHLWHGLRYARRHLHSRLCACLRFGGCPCIGAEMVAIRARQSRV